QEVHGCGCRRRLPESLHPEPGGRDAEARGDDGPRPEDSARDETRRNGGDRQDGGRRLGEARGGDRPREARRRHRDRCRRWAGRGVDVAEREDRIREEIKRGGTLSAVLEVEKWEQIR